MPRYVYLFTEVEAAEVAVGGSWDEALDAVRAIQGSASSRGGSTIATTSRTHRGRTWSPGSARPTDLSVLIEGRSLTMGGQTLSEGDWLSIDGPGGPTTEEA